MKLIIGFLFSLAAFGQCGRTVPNPETGKLDCVGTSSVAGSGAVVTSAFSATPTFTKGSGGGYIPVMFQPGAMTANVTAVTISGFSPGDIFSIAWLQDGTGLRTVAYGAGIVNTCQPWPDAGITTVQQFMVMSDGTYRGIGCSSDSEFQSLSTGALTETKIANASITQYQAVKLDLSGNVGPTSTSDVEFVGIAIQAPGSSGAVEIVRVGKTKAQVVGTATVKHLAIASTTVGGKVDDSGQTQLTAIPSTTLVIGRFLASGTGNVDIELYAPGTFGSQATGAGFDPLDLTFDYLFENWDPYGSGASTNVGLLRWGTAGTLAQVSASGVHMGVTSLATTAAANNIAYATLWTGGNGTASKPIGGNFATATNWGFKWIFKTPSATTEWQFKLGFSSQTPNAAFADTGVYLRYANSTGCTANAYTDATWQAFAGDSTNKISGSLGSIATDTWYTLYIRSTAAGTIIYSLTPEGGSTTTQTLTLASGSPGAVVPAVAYPVVQSITCNGTAKTISMDEFRWSQTGIAR
jgi:hypothetical protein